MGHTNLSKRYIECMKIGDYFNENYHDDKRTADWSGSEECAVVAKASYTLSHSLNMDYRDAVDFVMNKIFTYGFQDAYKDEFRQMSKSILYTDDTTRGFLAGEILGKPTEENIKKAECAERTWFLSFARYGYYQDVLNEIGGAYNEI